MGTVTIISTSFTTNSNLIKTTSVTTNYSCAASYTATPSETNPGAPARSGSYHGEISNSYWDTYSNPHLQYKWNFYQGLNTVSITTSNISGTQSFTGLSPGTYNYLEADVTAQLLEDVITYTQSYQWIVSGYYNPPQPNPDAFGGEDSEEYYFALEEWNSHKDEYWIDTSHWSAYGNTTSSTLTSIKTGEQTSNKIPLHYYTRPGIFTEFNFSQDTIIQSLTGLTATKVDHWITHCNKFAHWYNQNNYDVTSAACQVSTNDIITATWYNACVDACVDPLTKPAYVTGGPDGTIITTQIFADLGAAISKDDN